MFAEIFFTFLHYRLAYGEISNIYILSIFLKILFYSSNIGVM